MSRLKSCLLALLFSLTLALPVQAEVPSTSLEAAQLLQDTLGAGTTLGNADGPEILAALTAASSQHPEMLQEMASLVAVARPDMVDGLKETLRKINPLKADSIIKQFEQASNNPSVDQLAALANIEGAKPATGDNDSGTGAVSDSDDLGWATQGSFGDGSAN